MVNGCVKLNILSFNAVAVSQHLQPAAVCFPIMTLTRDCEIMGGVCLLYVCVSSCIWCCVSCEGHTERVDAAQRGNAVSPCHPSAPLNHMLNAALC